MAGGLPDFPNDNLGTGGEGYWVFIPWIIALVVLEALPVFGVECIFGWCVVATIHWKIIAAFLAFGVLAFFALVSEVFTRYL